jgi:hypothetical protein
MHTHARHARTIYIHIHTLMCVYVHVDLAYVFFVETRKQDLQNT